MGRILLQRLKKVPNKLAQPLSLQQEAENKSIAALTSATMRQLAKFLTAPPVVNLETAPTAKTFRKNFCKYSGSFLSSSFI